MSTPPSKAKPPPSPARLRGKGWTAAADAPPGDTPPDPATRERLNLARVGAPLQPCECFKTGGATGSGPICGCGKPRVAVLDDDPRVATTVTAMLVRHGFSAYSFNAPSDVLKATMERPFAAYVLDWFLGEETAQLLIAQLRAEVGKRTPIVLLSGNLSIAGVPTDPTLASMLNLHGAIYRSKPYSGAKLANDLKEALASPSIRPPSPRS